MAIEDIYSPKLVPIYADATEAYLRFIPAVETLGIPEQLARNPSATIPYLMDAFKANQDAVRDIETGRRSAAFKASVMMGLKGFSDLLATLPPEVRSQLEAWSNRIER